MQTIVKSSVLVLDGDIRKSLAVVRGLGHAYNITVVYSGRLPVAGLSKYCKKKIKADYGKGYCQEILGIIESEQPDYLVCTQEETIIRLNEIREELINTGVKLTFPDKQLMDMALDKSLTIKVAENLGVPIPMTLSCDSMEKLDEIEETIGYPVVIKPKRSIFNGTEGIVKTTGPSYASNAEQLREILNNSEIPISDYLFQKYIKGKGVGGFFLTDAAGKILLSFAHKRILDVNPTGSGSCLRESVDLNKEVFDYSKKLLEGIKWQGVAMVEFRMGDDGICYLMEINGRFWGSLALGEAAGINFPLALIKSVEGSLGHHKAPYKKGIRLTWELGMILRFLRILNGKPAGYPGKYPSRGQGVKELFRILSPKNKFEVLKWYDPLPFLGELSSGLKKI